MACSGFLDKRLDSNRLSHENCNEVRLKFCRFLLKTAYSIKKNVKLLYINFRWVCFHPFPIIFVRLSVKNVKMPRVPSLAHQAPDSLELSRELTFKYSCYFSDKWVKCDQNICDQFFARKWLNMKFFLIEINHGKNKHFGIHAFSWLQNSG